MDQSRLATGLMTGIIKDLLVIQYTYVICCMMCCVCNFTILCLCVISILKQIVQ